MKFGLIAVGDAKARTNVLNSSEQTRSTSGAVTNAPTFALIPDEVNEFFPPSLQERAQTHYRESVWLNPGAPSYPQLESATVLVGAWRLRDIPIDFLKSRGGNLEYLCLLVGSPKRSITRKHIEEGLLVTNWGNVCSPNIAEGALTLILSRLRVIYRYRDELVRLGKWNNIRAETATLMGKRVSIHGFGNLARALIRLLKPFNVSIAVYAPGVPVELIRAVGAVAVDSLFHLAENCDVFVEAEALRADNHGCINQCVLSRLPIGSVFVNVARGALVNEVDLVQVAKDRDLKVALDVYQQEPLPSDSPLFSIPDVLLLPHMSGPTKDIRWICGELALDNLNLYYAGQQPKNVIGLQEFDRIT
ncbi:NAD(P)-dependent oxidoreductase [Coraliomargarita algicola]|uniref:NAD(P)-dependent oxidoreductase n=1 Tax=Coraliomargarita algicola TaxID=3092156 RepID=A0ABZ0RNN8_9BACT|nr:NAD(P)-dependent oxidoreductase [Coraliomargarita sp. J2-16]WPJ97841.1 NAD(P)-dependent oxidoreductase [Coraliomargarita sp. J2-16]